MQDKDIYKFVEKLSKDLNDKLGGNVSIKVLKVENGKAEEINKKTTDNKNIFDFDDDSCANPFCMNRPEAKESKIQPENDDTKKDGQEEKITPGKVSVTIQVKEDQYQVIQTLLPMLEDETLDGFYGVAADILIRKLLPRIMDHIIDRISNSRKNSSSDLINEMFEKMFRSNINSGPVPMNKEEIEELIGFLRNSSRGSMSSIFDHIPNSKRFTS